MSFFSNISTTPLFVGSAGVSSIELVQQVSPHDIGSTIGIVTQLVIGVITLWKLIFPKKIVLEPKNEKSNELQKKVD